MKTTLRPTITLDKSEYERLQLAAIAEHRTVSNLIKQIVRVYLRGLP
ncbi:MAG: ribbon-helix-helix protein, CopG family [Oscillospiraceae bacterium]|nr:ribbon-helix-helix protein, CopG family [Oscillospiraceae bacterium]